MLPSDSEPKLHLLVSDSTRELCRAAMPLSSVANLEHLFPDEDLQVVRATGIDFASIISRAENSGYAPQTLIDTRTPHRSYRIWIA
jgi:hypothetical protein